MKKSSAHFFRGTAIMIGTIVGVGIFGVPFVVAKTGILIGVGYFIVLGAILLLNHLLYGEAMLRTGVREHLAALTRTYLGKKWEVVAVIITTLGFYGALVAYIILGGSFFEIILEPYFGGNLFSYQVLFFIFMAFFVLVGIRLIAFAEILMTVLLIVTIGIISFSGIPHIDFTNFLHFDFNNFFLPYGVILFSLSGAAAIPEVVEVMTKGKRKVKSAIVWGTIIPIILTAVFAIIVVGINGINTSHDAIQGLGFVIGDWIKYIGAIFGLFAVATSFLIMALYLKEQFWYDLKLNPYLSWGLACIVPFLIFLFGSRNFIAVISFTGAVFAGFEALLIIWVYKMAKRYGKRKPEYSLKIPPFLLWFTMLIFVLGIIYEIWTLF